MVPGPEVQETVGSTLVSLSCLNPRNRIQVFYEGLWMRGSVHITESSSDRFFFSHVRPSRENTLPLSSKRIAPTWVQNSCALNETKSTSSIGVSEMRGMPHTVKVERHQNELVVHVALLHGPE